jgi:hypothetical protein
MKRLNLILFCSVLFLMSLSNLIAQESNKIRVGVSLDVGRTFELNKLDFGIGISLDPTYNISDHQTIGFSFGAFAMAKNIEDNSLSSEAIGMTSILGTYDHFIKIQPRLVYSLGGGVGVFNLSHMYSMSTSPTSLGINETVFQGMKPGIMLRPGLEYSKFRISIEFNLIPSHSYDAQLNNFSGINLNSFFKWKVGFIIGGGNH